MLEIERDRRKPAPMRQTVRMQSNQNAARNASQAHDGPYPKQADRLQPIFVRAALMTRSENIELPTRHLSSDLQRHDKVRRRDERALNEAALRAAFLRFHAMTCAPAMAFDALTTTPIKAEVIGG